MYQFQSHKQNEKKVLYEITFTSLQAHCSTAVATALL